MVRWQTDAQLRGYIKYRQSFNKTHIVRGQVLEFVGQNALHVHLRCAVRRNLSCSRLC